MDDARHPQDPPDREQIHSPLTPAQRLKKKRLIRQAILVCLALIPFFIWLESSLFKTDLSLPVSSDILIFGLINLNVILILLMLFLILRSLAELLFDSRRKILGSKLKTKLVISFIGLSLIPTGLLFFVALQFVSTSMDYWFNSDIERSLQRSLELAQSVLDDKRQQATNLNRNLSARLAQDAPATINPKSISQTLEKLMGMDWGINPDSLALILGDHNTPISVPAPTLAAEKLPGIPSDLLNQIRADQQPRTIIQEFQGGDLVRSLSPVQFKDQTTGAILITTLLIDNERLEQMTAISQGIDDYRQLKFLKNPFKFWLLILLLIVTLLIVFAAIWFGFYIARGITGPLDQLAAGTRRVADGDLGFVLTKETDDEMGALVDSFNRMTSHLNTSKRELAETLVALQHSSQKSEQGRRYTEIILQNVAAGVISLDEQDRITTINRFAEKLLNIDKTLFLGRDYHQAMAPEHQEIISSFMDELGQTRKNSTERHLRVNILGETFSLLVNFTRLEDETGHPLGFVIVFDNLTKLEKMQRMAAWREVARRIAHEVKNPLTPIQLSAQRLRRRYPEILAQEDSVFDQCTATIINQVDELKRLVSEFSQFARMPKIKRAPADLTAVCKSTLFLYQEAHRQITFTCHSDPALPRFNFDAEQIKRCLINLLDNAVAVLPGGGTIDTELSLDEEQENVFIRVADNGPGIPENDKPRLFEPYFSTKKTGTGLGLAIVSTIISDHNGYIRVHNNQPQGTVFTIELPLFQQQPASAKT